MAISKTSVQISQPNQSIEPNATVAKPQTLLTPQNSSQTPLNQQNVFESNPTPLETPSSFSQLQTSIQQGNLLQRPTKGAEVTQLQTLLNRAGADPALEADGDLGSKTQRAIKLFQQQQGIRVDGIVGPEMLRALETSLGLPSLPPSSTQAPVRADSLIRNDTFQRAQNTQPLQPNNIVTSDFAPEAGRAASAFSSNSEERVLQATQLAQANGIDLRDPANEGRVIAVQIDQDNPPSTSDSSSKRDFYRSYTGETSVFQVQNGQMVEVSDNPYRSAAHPSTSSVSTSAYGTPDADRDGRMDIAHLPSGVYNYSSNPRNNRFNPTSNFGVYRDVNHDGVISQQEQQNNYYGANDRSAGTGIQIHAGGSGSPSSVGCQTMPPSDYNRFMSDITRNAGSNGFTYLVVRRENDNPALQGGTKI